MTDQDEYGRFKHPVYYENCDPFNADLKPLGFAADEIEAKAIFVRKRPWSVTRLSHATAKRVAELVECHDINGYIGEDQNWHYQEGTIWAWHVRFVPKEKRGRRPNNELRLPRKNIAGVDHEN